MGRIARMEESRRNPIRAIRVIRGESSASSAGSGGTANAALTLLRTARLFRAFAEPSLCPDDPKYSLPSSPSHRAFRGWVRIA
jgi:hypothetical protein